MELEELVFIIDLNELTDGDLLPLSMDFTLTHGPRVRMSQWQMPRVGELVKLHSDDDDSLYYGTVTQQVTGRDFEVRIDWESCAPVLNRSWSARTDSPFATGPSKAMASENMSGV
jgi:hypothetical protein